MTKLHILVHFPVIAVLAGVTQVPVESYDDFDSVMKKLELSAASLADVVANKEMNFASTAAGQYSCHSITESYVNNVA